MELSINALLERTDDFLTERATQGFRRAAGIERDGGLGALHQGFPELSRVETYLKVRELLDSPRIDDSRKSRLKSLQVFLAGCVLEARTAEHHDAIDELLRTTPLASAGRQWMLGDALRETPRQPSRDARVTLSADAAAALWDAQAPFARRADATPVVAAELGLGSAEALVDLLHRRSVGDRFGFAERLLRDTADACRDLLAYALKRLEPQLKPGAAALHDAERAINAPWLFELFRREDLTHAVSRTFDDLGLHPSAHGRIAIDTQPRIGRDSQAQRFEVDVPDDVRLLLLEGPGFETYAGWLSAWGGAQARALVSRSLPFVERVLGDGTVVDAVSRLFESLVRDPKWLMRYLRLTTPQAKEAARLFAFRQLWQLRREAALFSASRELLARGPVRPLADEFAARMSDALGVEVPKARFLFDVSPTAEHALVLDAAALETALHAHVVERFNEDFWRNPAAGRWLSDFASKGQRDDAAAVASAHGLKELDVSRLGAVLVSVMGS